MKIHEATIKDARRRTNEAFDSALIIFTIPVSETDVKEFKLEMVNHPFLLNKLFDYTNTTSKNINDIIGKSLRVCLDGRGAIGHPTENCFVIPNIFNKEFTLEEALENV